MLSGFLNLSSLLHSFNAAGVMPVLIRLYRRTPPKLAGRGARLCFAEQNTEQGLQISPCCRITILP